MDQPVLQLRRPERSGSSTPPRTREQWVVREPTPIAALTADAANDLRIAAAPTVAVIRLAVDDRDLTRARDELGHEEHLPDRAATLEICVGPGAVGEGERRCDRDP